MGRNEELQDIENDINELKVWEVKLQRIIDTLGNEPKIDFSDVLSLCEFNEEFIGIEDIINERFIKFNTWTMDLLKVMEFAQMALSHLEQLFYMLEDKKTELMEEVKNG